MIHIHHLFISPGHNYVGHHGVPPGEHPILEMKTVECVAGRGIRGDRYFDFKEDHKGQITFFSKEVLDALESELGLQEAQPTATRRNVIVSGIDLNSLIGQEFEIQGVRFAGVEECRPCYWMNRAFDNAQVETWLKNRGGLRARVLTDGVLRRDDGPSLTTATEL
jgi:MOSC domain-containing protein YiiM